MSRRRGHARGEAQQAPQQALTVAADMPVPTELEIRASIERYDKLLATARGDLTTMPMNRMLVPTIYHQFVERTWDGYNTDPLFRRLVDRSVEFAANGSHWEVTGERPSKGWIESVDEQRGRKYEQEEEFWNYWASQVNVGVPNVIPGLDEVTRWAAKHLMLSGMFVPHWELGTMRFGKRDFIVPTKLTCYPANAIQLQRMQQLFIEETIHLRMPTNAPGALMQEGMTVQANPTAVTGTPLAGYAKLNQVGEKLYNAGLTEAFALKFGWTPGDLVTTRVGLYSETGQGVYPRPPFATLIPQFVIRQKLFASDLAILDGVIEFLMLWKIGSKEVPPQPPIVTPGGTTTKGTIADVMERIRAARAGRTQEYFLPYYVDLDVKMPDTATLINESKYVQSTREMFHAFGILTPPNTGARDRMERINIANFEEFVASIRAHVRGLLQGVMAPRIIQLNPGRLTQPPTWMPNPINTKAESYLAQLFNLAKLGRVSLRTLLRNHGLDPDAELRRIADELELDVDDLLDANVPTSYVQQTVQPPDVAGRNRDRLRQDGQPAKPDDAPVEPPTKRGPGRPRTKETSITPGLQQGRPKEKLTAKLAAKGRR